VLTHCLVSLPGTVNLIARPVDIIIVLIQRFDSVNPGPANTELAIEMQYNSVLPLVTDYPDN